MILKEIDNYQIQKYLNKCKKFKGVYLCTNLPKLQNGYYIINISENIMGKGLGDPQGTHWVTAIIEPTKIYYIDPFGLIPNSYIQNWFRERTNYIIYNPNDLQGLSKQSCGYFCVYFVSEYCKKRKINDILNDFTNKVESNEKILIYYFK